MGLWGFAWCIVHITSSASTRPLGAGRTSCAAAQVVISVSMKTLRELNEDGGKLIEEFLRALSVLLGYWFIAQAIIRILDIVAPAWWREGVLSLVFRDWDFGAYLVYDLLPSLLAVAAFCIWRPKKNLVRWLLAPIGFIALVAVG